MTELLTSVYPEIGAWLETSTSGKTVTTLLAFVTGVLPSKIRALNTTEVPTAIVPGLLTSPTLTAEEDK
jgi:siroheme synthase